MRHAASRKAPKPSITHRLLRLMASVAGLIPIIVAAGPSAIAQNTDYKPAAEAPPAWRAFAAELQSRLQERLAADDDATRGVRGYLDQNSQNSLSFIVRTWIAQNGKVERIEFDGIDDPAISMNLRALLSGASVSAPPPEMLQPLRLRLGLRAPDRQEH